MQIHHVLPREHAAHPLLRNFDLEDARNLMFLPTREGRRRGLRLHAGRPTHDGGHAAYNAHVRARLDAALTTGETAEQLCAALRGRLRGRTDGGDEDGALPWR